MNVSHWIDIIPVYFAISNTLYLKYYIFDINYESTYKMKMKMNSSDESSLQTSISWKNR
jgi:hypothetical protein